MEIGAIREPALANYFTGCEDIRARFEALIGGEQWRPRVVIHGVGGAGKSSLLQMFRLQCAKHSVPSALASADQARSVPAILAAWASDLAGNRVLLPGYAKEMARLLSIDAKVGERVPALQRGEHRVGVTRVVASRSAEAATGVIAGAAIGSVVPGIGSAVGAAVGGGVVGYMVGEHRALEIRFTAQLALCQVAIEESTWALRAAGGGEGVARGEGAGSTARRIEPVFRAEAPIPTAVGGGTVPQGTSEPSMSMPSGEWVSIEGPRPGRYVVVTGDPRNYTLSMATGKIVALGRRSGGVWISTAENAGALFPDDSYGWAKDFEQPGMILGLDTGDHPVVLLRWADQQ